MRDTCWKLNNIVIARPWVWRLKNIRPHVCWLQSECCRLQMLTQQMHETTGESWPRPRIIGLTKLALKKKLWCLCWKKCSLHRTVPLCVMTLLIFLCFVLLMHEHWVVLGKKKSSYFKVDIYRTSFMIKDTFIWGSVSYIPCSWSYRVTQGAADISEHEVFISLLLILNW